MECIVDEKNLERLSRQKWTLNSKGVPTTTLRKKPVTMAEFLTRYTHVEFLNGNALDNRECNLLPGAPRHKRGVVQSKTKGGIVYNVWIGRNTTTRRGSYATREQAEIEHDRIALAEYGEGAPCLRAPGGARIRIGVGPAAYDSRPRRVPAGCVLSVDTVTGVVGVGRGRYTDEDQARMRVLGRSVVDDTRLVAFWNEYCVDWA